MCVIIPHLFGRCPPGFLTFSLHSRRSWRPMGKPHVSIVALVVCLSATACEKSPRDRLQGRWLGESIENVPVDQVQKATGWVKGTAIEFSGNKVTVTIPAETPRTGTFKVTKAEGDTLLVSFLREEG